MKRWKMPFYLYHYVPCDKSLQELMGWCIIDELFWPVTCDFKLQLQGVLRDKVRKDIVFGGPSFFCFFISVCTNTVEGGRQMCAQRAKLCSQLHQWNLNSFTEFTNKSSIWQRGSERERETHTHREKYPLNDMKLISVHQRMVACGPRGWSVLYLLGVKSFQYFAVDSQHRTDPGAKGSSNWVNRVICQRWIGVELPWL